LGGALAVAVTVALSSSLFPTTWQVAKLSGVLSVAGLVLLAGAIVAAVRREARGWLLFPVVFCFTSWL